METAAGTSSPVRVRPAAARGAAVPPAAPSSAAVPVTAAGEVPQEQVRQKKRMVISHDQYINLRDMIVIHLQHHENATGRGLDREELIDWYLEERESQIHDIDELEYEKELIGKLLRKLVKVSTFTPLLFPFSDVCQENYLLEIRGDVQESLPSMDTEESSLPSGDAENVRMYYMVHPSVDTEGLSGF